MKLAAAPFKTIMVPVSHPARKASPILMEGTSARAMVRAVLSEASGVRAEGVDLTAPER
jgi:hypothetical protein